MPLKSTKSVYFKFRCFIHETQGLKFMHQTKVFSNNYHFKKNKTSAAKSARHTAR